jgi:hypothetical protein
VFCYIATKKSKEHLHEHFHLCDKYSLILNSSVNLRPYYTLKFCEYLIYEVKVITYIIILPTYYFFADVKRLLFNNKTDEVNIIGSDYYKDVCWMFVYKFYLNKFYCKYRRLNILYILVLQNQCSNIIFVHVNKQDINILVVHEPTLTAPSAVIRGLKSVARVLMPHLLYIYTGKR